MKILIIVFLICSCTQNFNRDNTERSNSLLLHDCQIIYTKKSIGANVLNKRAGDLLSRIESGEELSQKEDIDIIMIMNTISYFGSSNLELKTCRYVFDLQKNFDKGYLEKLRNKYTLCTSSSTLKFKELKIGYVGNPSNCSRYTLALDSNEQEKIIESHEIVSEKNTVISIGKT